MRQIRVGIIGQGRSGRDIHAAYLKTDPVKFKIVAVVDPMQDRCALAADELKCDTYADHKPLLKRTDIDLIVNATPSHLHVPVTRQFLKAGFNVLCEKPLAHRAKEVDRLIDAATKSGKLLAIFQQAHFAPYFQQLQNVINSGVLGRIVQISVRAFNGFSRRWDWQTLQECNGGSLLNTGPHPLEQVLILFGDGQPKVSCWMDRVNTFGDAEDHVKIILSGEGHPTIDLEVSSCCAFPDAGFNVYGTCGGLKGSTAAMEWKYFLPSEAPEQKLVKEPLRKPDGTPNYCAETLKWHTGSWPENAADEKKDKDAAYVPSAPAHDNTAVFYNALHKTLTEGAPLVVTPAMIRRQIAVIEECHKQNPQIYLRGKKAAQ